MTVAEQQCGPHAAVILLRETVMRLAVASVGIGRLTLFSDYGLMEDDLKKLRAIEVRLGELIDDVGTFEDGWRNHVENLGTVKNGGGLV